MRRAVVAALASGALLCALPEAASAIGDLAITPTPTQRHFPVRSFLLTLPDKQALDAGDLDVTENGQPVRDLKVESSAIAGSAVILAIDTSNSMRGQPIKDAMEAAREFAVRRRVDQKLGIVFFNREPIVALEPTTDPARIDEVLSGVPVLAKGTRLYDGANASLELLDRTDSQVSGIVLLSDGADTSSRAQPPEVVAAAREQRVRLYAVGLRSDSYDAAGLQSLAETGAYTEAASSGDLREIFATLGRRFSSEYVLTYRSRAPLDTRVAVFVSIDEPQGSAATAYETPHLDLRVYKPQNASSSAWARPGAVVTVALIIAALLATALYIALRPRTRTVSERVESFATTEPRDIALDQRAPPVRVLVALERRLDRFSRWQRFKLDVELAKIRIPAIRLALITVTATATAMWLLGVLAGRPITALCFLLLPVAVRMYAGIRAHRVRRAFADQLPDNLQVLASALRAGHSFTGALSVMCEDAAEPSRSEYGRVVLDDQLGVAIEDSMKVVAERMDNADVGYIGLIATIQRESGGNTAEVLDRVTATVRERATLRRLIRTLTAQGRLGAWIVTLLPVCVIGFLTLVQPDYISPMLESPMGRIVLGIGVLSLGAGAWVLRRIVDIKV
jgi:tight adherence protein B